MVARCLRINGKFFSSVKNFAIFNVGGAEIARITKKVFSFLPTFFAPKYQIDVLGLNVEGNFWAMDFVIKKGAKTVAVINKKLLRDFVL